MKRSLSAKFALFAFLVAGFSILLTSTQSYRDAASLLYQQSTERLGEELARQTIRFAASLARIEQDVEALKRVKAIDGLIAVHGKDNFSVGPTINTDEQYLKEKWKQQLALEFSSLLRQRPEYTQVRFIAKADQGREIVRIERKNNEIRHVPESQLQQKGHRQYVQQTLLLRPGDIYLSAIELNIEYGAIVKPIEPVLRVATPIYFQGESLGLIIINVDFRILSKPFRNPPTQVSYFIADQQGGYLLNSDISKEFSHYLDTDTENVTNSDIFSDYPSVFRADQPLTDIKAQNIPNSELTLITKLHHYDKLDSRRFLLLGSVVSNQLLNQNAEDFRQRLLLRVLLVVILLSIAMALLSKYLLGPIKIVTQFADRIAQGDRSITMPKVQSHDEIGVLTQAINTMVNKHNQTHQQLQTLAATYEQQVIERTAQLAQSVIRAEKDAQVKSEFLATISHEIRTPMNGVLGMLALLLESKLNDEQYQRTRLAQSSAESLLSLINDILDFSSVDAGKLTLKPIDFDLYAMIGDFMKVMASQAAHKDIEIVLDLANVTTGMVKGDPGRIQQILANLINNAIKFTEQGEIVVRMALRSGKDARHRVLYFGVTDTGIGISEDKQATIFDAFTQGDGSNTRKHGGSGLGLALVKQLCQLMDGDIRVTSNVSEGSCFEVELSLEVSREPAEIHPVNLQDHHIIVASSNAALRDSLTKALVILGAQVQSVASGQQALDCYQANNLAADKDPKADPPENEPVNVLFIDGSLTDMNFIQFAEQWQQIAFSQPAKLVAMDRVSSQCRLADLTALGYSQLLFKPIATYTLYELMLAIVDDQTRLRQLQRLNKAHSWQNQLTKVQVHDFSSNDDKAVTRVTHDVETVEQQRILLVEDSLINQLVVQGILKQFGLVVDIAANGIEALAVLNESPTDSPYSLILMDCHMPEMDGYEASRAIRKGEAGERYQQVVIVALTANVMKGAKESCFAAGMNDYLSKPVQPQVLLNTITQWVGHSQ